MSDTNTSPTTPETLKIGDRSFYCLNCGQYEPEIKLSQKTNDPLYCATVDYFGECMQEWDRHRFIWTKGDQADLEFEIKQCREYEQNGAL